MTEQIPVKSEPAELKVGDYIGNAFTLAMTIKVILKGADGQIYGVSHLKDNGMLQWVTDEQLASEGLVKLELNWKQFDNVEIGDTIFCGRGPAGDSYARVLARAANAVLLSQSANQNAAKLLNMLDKIETEEGNPALAPEEKARLQEQASQIRSQKLVGSWVSLDQMVLSNYRLVKEE